MLAQITLSPEESKRIIAKAVAEHPAVKVALKDGIVAIGLGSTNAYIVEEILREKIEKHRYIAGFVDSLGCCVLPPEKRLKEVVLHRGKVVEKNILDIAEELKSGDVVIKGANAIDVHGNAGVMLASDVGGTIAKVYGIIKARGVNLIVPVSLDKLIPHDLGEISKIAGMGKIELSIGHPVGVFPVAGEIITEETAFKMLFDVDAKLISGAGINGRALTFLLSGEGEKVRKAFEFVKKIKGEPAFKTLPHACAGCTFKRCPGLR